ncbi:MULTISPECIES: acyltransferase [Caulobacter]|uniref:Putative acyltransferase n=1 Tax=Caulobacter vibrioides OR37 TaxID=1292034 RepID=R0CYJ8_CAUVI|nr:MULTISPECIES: acyltransferase [Caulobacter]ENZ81546.1 putative acyltransferase [Caulobacter vibrioides OR37]MBQ1563354.1 acyltransferase [Caulobacter sp.]
MRNEPTGRRYETLDGLRGVAAVAVLLYHIGGWTGRPWLATHGYLAVDFFFCLSGFVLAHAYGRRDIGWLGFMRERLIRLWPLIAITMLAGATVIIQHRERVPGWLVLGLLMIPRLWTQDDGFSPIFPLNPPAWSLFFELLVGAAWFPLRRLGTMGHVLLGVLLTPAMLFIAHGMGGVLTGWDRATFVISLIRTACSFTLGWACYRLQGYTRLSLPAWLLALVVAAAFCAPWTALNWLYDFVCLGLVFPFVVLAGRGDPDGFGGALCRVSGAISYPLYVLHWLGWELLLRAFRAMGGEGYPAGFALTAIPLILAGAWAMLKLYDEPVRRRLKAL